MSPIRSDSSGKPHQNPNLTSSALSRLPCGLQSTRAVFGVARQLGLQNTLPLQCIMYTDTHGIYTVIITHNSTEGGVDSQEASLVALSFLLSRFYGFGV